MPLVPSVRFKLYDGHLLSVHVAAAPSVVVPVNPIMVMDGVQRV